MSTRIHKPPTLRCAAATWPEWQRELPSIDALRDRANGLTVTDHRSSWVRRHGTARGEVFAKTYVFPTWWSRLRGGGKRTLPWSKSRPQREFEALTWLRANGFDGPEPLAVFEWRRLGWLVCAVLVTRGVDAPDAQRLLPTLPQSERDVAGLAIATFVGRLHAAGFRDGNLDLRNLLLIRTTDAWRVQKIDSPRYRLVAPGVRHDRHTAADWQRLLPQLRAAGVATTAPQP